MKIFLLSMTNNLIPKLSLKMKDMTSMRPEVIKLIDFKIWAKETF